MNLNMLFGAVLAAVLSFSAHAFAQGSQCFAGGPWLPNPMEAHQLATDVYWVEGGGGNSTVIVGEKGVIVVDTKVSKPAGQELLANIAKITSKPVTTVILTHSDGDHSNGLAAFPAGIKIIAQDGANKELLAAVAKGGGSSALADHLPNQIITKPKETVMIEGETIELYHWVPAHTSGDLVVYLPKQKIVATGDLFSTQCRDGIIHLEKSGSTAGWLASGKGVADLNADQFVLGHGSVHDQTWIKERYTRLAETRAKVKEMVGQGKSLDEVRAALGEQPPPAPSPGTHMFPSFIEDAYAELSKN